jgi:hypothetical protein
MAAGTLSGHPRSIVGRDPPDFLIVFDFLALILYWPSTNTSLGEVNMAKRTILGVQVTNRLERAQDVQQVLTEYGCNIKTRLGLHEVSGSECSTVGLLIVETYGDRAEIQQMEAKLKKIKGLVVKKMVFQE